MHSELKTSCKTSVSISYNNAKYIEKLIKLKPNRIVSFFMSISLKSLVWLYAKELKSI